jgi:hypothetical protein
MKVEVQGTVDTVTLTLSRTELQDVHKLVKMGIQSAYAMNDVRLSKVGYELDTCFGDLLYARRVVGNIDLTVKKKEGE